MRAVIHPPASLDPFVCLLPVAGRPLIVRQLQWLRANGVEQVVVVLPPSALGDAVARRLADERVSRDVYLLREEVSVREAARRAGFPDDASFVALPYDVLGDGDLTRLLAKAEAAGARGVLAPPCALPWRRHPTVDVLGPDPRAERRTVVGPGWGVSVRTLGEALELGDAILRGRLPEAGPEHLFPVQVHGVEIAPGVWTTRGARIHPRARLVGPAWIDRDCVVEAEAQVGPGAHLSAGAVVTRGCRVVRGYLGEDAMLEEGTRLVDAAATIGGGVRGVRCGEATSATVRPRPRWNARATLVAAAMMIATLAMLAL